MAFVDDPILAIRGDSVGAAENYPNGELKKIRAWSNANKIRFNEKKPKIMLVSRRKRKEPKVLKVYLNNKLLEQVNTMKYLGIIIDHKCKFKEYITYVAQRCTKLMYNLSRPVKLT